MRLAVIAVAIGCLWSTSAFAQDDEAMEVQRCIWRCQAEGGSSWKRYQQCVSVKCNGEPSAKQSKPRVEKKKKSKSSKRRVIRNRYGDVLIRRL